MRNTPTSVVQTKMMIDHETIIQKHVFHCVSLCFTLTFDPSFTRQHVIHAKWTTLLKKYTHTYDYYNSVFCFIKQQISMNQWQLEFMTINDNQWQSMTINETGNNNATKTDTAATGMWMSSQASVASDQSSGCTNLTCDPKDSSFLCAWSVEFMFQAYVCPPMFFHIIWLYDYMIYI